MTLAILFTFSGCFEKSGQLQFSGMTGNLSLAISSPTPLSVHPETDLSTMVISGTCSADGDVTITALAQTETVRCAGGIWYTTLDLSSWSSGNLVINASMKTVSENAVVRIDDAGPISTVISPSATLSQFSDDRTFTWSAADALSSLRSTDVYRVNIYTNGTCTGMVQNTYLQDSASFTLSAMMDGITYSVSVRAFDEYDHEGAAVCFPSVGVNRTAPTLSLSDATTSSNSYIRQVASAAAITNSTTAKKWCLSESATTAPASTDTCFTSTKPTSISFSTGDNAKTAYLWVADSSGTVLATTVSDSITLDTGLPATPSVSLTGVESASTSYTNAASNTLAITADTDAVRWCVAEVAGSASAPTKPLFNDTCFVSSRPVSHTLSGRGSRKVYVFTSDLAGNISDGGLKTFSFPVPTAATSSGPSQIFTQECSPAVVIRAMDVNNLSSPADTALAFTLSDAAAGGTFYSDPGCLTSATSVTIASGAKTANYYYKTSTAGSPVLTATSGTIVTTQSLSVTLPNIVVPGRNGMTCGTFDGAGYCWGAASGTTFGNNIYEQSRSVPLAISALAAGTTFIEAGEDHACAIQNGGLKCWGQSWAGQTGANTTSPQPTPITPTGLATGVTAVASGVHYTCAVRNGALWCFGWNNFGQLGIGTTTDSLVPVAVPTLASGVTAIDSGTHFSCAIHNGGVKCWGINGGGNLGDGTTVDKHVPTQVQGLDSDVTALALGDFHACAIHQNKVKCWGGGWSGQLGNGTNTSSNAPVTVTAFSGTPTAIQAGAASTCAIVDGEHWCWGVDSHGQRGDGSPQSWSGYTVDKVTTLTGLSHFKMAAATACATIGGVQKCWGNNDKNQLGSGAFVLAHLPLTARGITGTVSKVSTGNTTCIVNTSGAVQCWGAGEYGQIGDNGSIHRPIPYTVAGVTSGATKVTTGSNTSCAVISGGVRCWGSNDNGELGVTDWRLIAPGTWAIASGSGATDVAISLSGSRVCAVVSGNVVCWGRGSNVPTTVSGLSGISKIAVAENHACALSTAGAVTCWGTNTSGQIGTGATSATESLFEVFANSATDISVGLEYSCAVVSSNLHCWGFSGYGQTGYTGTQSSPTRLAALDGTVSQVRSSTYHSCVITTTGTAKCFGRNNDNQLGNTAGANSNPQLVPNISSITDLSLGEYHSCAVTSGTLKCWGANPSAAHSDGNMIITGTPVDVVLPSEIRIAAITPPASFAANACSNAFTASVTTAVTSATTIELYSSDGLFYPASSNCDVAAVTSVTIASGSTGAQFKYRATTSGVKNLGAKGARTSKALSTVTVTP